MGHPTPSDNPDPVYNGHMTVTYQDIHITIGETAKKIKAEFKPDIMIAIGGGGFFPARVLRTFLKSAGKNIPIQAIGLSLYEELPNMEAYGTKGLSNAEKIGKEVIRTQWLDFSTLGKAPLLGRRILIVDEVDDSRTTLSYAVSELRKDINAQLALLPEDQRAANKTELAIFVVHNKLKTKAASIPEDVAYFSGADIEDRWVDYPWEQQDILLHDSIAHKQKELGL